MEKFHYDRNQTKSFRENATNVIIDIGKEDRERGSSKSYEKRKRSNTIQNGTIPL
jgi:hypothetical protein